MLCPTLSNSQRSWETRDLRRTARVGSPEEWRLFHRGGRSLEPGPGEASEWNRSWRGGRLHATLRRPHVVTSLHEIMKHSCGKYTLLGTNIWLFLYLAPHFWNILRWTNISNLGRRNIIFKHTLGGDEDEASTWETWGLEALQLLTWLPPRNRRESEGRRGKEVSVQTTVTMLYTPLYTIISPLIIVYTYHKWFISVVLCVTYIYILCIGILLNIYVLRIIYRFKSSQYQYLSCKKSPIVHRCAACPDVWLVSPWTVWEIQRIASPCRPVSSTSAFRWWRGKHEGGIWY